jgi:hypothetical protein
MRLGDDEKDYYAPRPERPVAPAGERA